MTCGMNIEAARAIYEAMVHGGRVSADKQIAFVNYSLLKSLGDQLGFEVDTEMPK